MLLIFFISTLAFTGLSQGESILPGGILNASVGGTVMFTTTLPPTERPFNVITWTFDSSVIISHEPEKNTTSPEYDGRITLFISTGSLELRNLKESDSGTYRIKIFPGSLGGEKLLRVFVPVYEIIIFVVTNSTDFVESSSSVSLSCSASGSSPLSFSWMNGTCGVTESDRVQLANGNATLIITAVTRYDTGLYRCKVTNAISDATSFPLNINVNYGPENIKLIPYPSAGPHYESTNVHLSCSAESTPAAQFTWFLNGNKLPDAGSELPLKNIQTDQRGNYSCQAFNTKTLKSQTSELLSIDVLASDSGLTPGAIAGIIIAVLFVIGGVGTTVYFFTKKPKTNSSNTNNSTATGNGTNSSQVDFNYYENVN